MKHRSIRAITVITLAASIAASVPTVAFATSTHTSVSAKTSTTTATDRLAWKTWHASWTAYVQGIKSINATFRTSLEGARSAYRTALAAATTKTDRLTARTNLDKAIAAAFATRVAAISAAGNPPAPPAGYNATAYVAGIQNANVAFRGSLAAAQSVFAQSILAANTVAQRSAAHAALRLAINNAIIARAQAIIALGAAPLNPGKKLA